ncbi:MAG TPA: NADH-quinone oxidoreductase subunit NuoB [Thermodesulfobacteriota bacterium]
MLRILRRRLAAGILTTRYPETPPEVSPHARGAPRFDLAAWSDARPAAAACPTGAIRVEDAADRRQVTIDLGRCVMCGLCAEADPQGAVTMSGECELATTRREALVGVAHYELDAEGRQVRLLSDDSLVRAGDELARTAHGLFGRSLHVRQVDAGSCNGCEVEITNLSGPVYDVERFGVHFVASPRHADLLLVTGPVTRNMEEPLRKAYEAMPPPRLVVAAGACGISGGIFGVNYATLGGVDAILPVDVYVPGCPPNPFALIQGLLLAMGRWTPRRA